MNPKEVVKSAAFRGVLILGERYTPLGKRQELFTEIEHYFNKDMEEIAMIGFPDTSLEGITVFNPPRIWGDCNKQSLKLTKLNP